MYEYQAERQVKMKRLLLAALVISVVLFTACGTPTTAPELPPDAIPWDEAKYHIAEQTTVCGTVVDVNWFSEWPTESAGEHTLLNMGNPDPDPERFIVVILSHNLDNFPQSPEEYYLGKTICVTGLITDILYQGVPQMEVKDPSLIQEQ